MCSAFSAVNRLTRLRKLMNDANLDALIVPSGDCHNSEYPPDRYKRRQYLSGFDGSAGTAVVTGSEALLWTDGRYFLQAEQQLDASCWGLMKDGLTTTPSIEKWLDSNDSISTVGADPATLGVSFWNKLQKCKKLKFTSTEKNLVDEVWQQEDVSSAKPPPFPMAPIVVQPLEFAGRSAEEKIGDARQWMKKESIGATFLSETSELAWLLNLRGGDIAFTPVFIGFCVLLQDAVLLYCHEEKITPDAKQHLESIKVTVRPYETVWDDLLIKYADQRFVMDPSVCLRAYLSISNPLDNVMLALNPVKIAKAKKNKVEIAASRAAHVVDASALIRFLHWLEKAAADGSIQKENEKTAAEKLNQLRLDQELCTELSFPSISSMSANGAIIHYSPPDTGSKQLSNGVYLIDSGGQYRGATTDVTRTVHLGEPTNFERDCWTRVLKGHIQLDSAIFPKGTKGPQLDALARMHLWAVGLNYQHGTGHGVGAQLCVHEGPCGIGPLLEGPMSETALEPGMILSNEPGCYIDGHFGVRHENLVHVIRSSDYDDFLAFETLTLVPFQKKFMETSILTEQEIQWINAYHLRVWTTLRSSFQTDTEKEVLEWLRNATSPVSKN